MNISEEKMNTNVNSKLAKELLVIFEEVIEYRDNLSDDNNKINKVIDYAESHMLPKYTKIIKNQIGLKVNQIHISEEPTVYFGICIEIGNDDGKAWHSIMDAYSGVPHKNTPSLAKDMKKITDSIDKDVLKVNNVMVNKSPISVFIVIDLYSMFLSKETVNVELDRWSAKELVAMQLHEIGHFFAMIELGANESQTIVSYMESINYFNKYAPISEKLKYIDTTMKDKEVIASTDTVKENYKRDKSTIAEKFTRLYTTMVLCVMVTVTQVSSIIFSKYYDNNANNNSNIKNDLYSTKRNKSIDEKAADEFVSTQGYGDALVSAISKLYTYNEILHVNKQYSLNPTASLNRLKTANKLLNLACEYDSTGGGIYPEMGERLAGILRDNIAILKQSDISPNTRDIYFRECNSILKNIEKYKKINKSGTRVKNIQEFIGNYMTPKGIKDFFKTKRFDTRYSELLTNLDKLNNNILYLTLAKLKNYK